MPDADGHLVIPDAPVARTKSVEERLGKAAPSRGSAVAPDRPLPMPGANGEGTEPDGEISEDVQKEFDALKARTEASDRAAAEANRRYQEAENARRDAVAKAKEAHESAFGAELDSVTRRIESLTQQRVSLLSERKTALTDLNYDKESELTDKLTDLSAELRDLNRTKAQIETEKAKKPQPDATAERQPQYASQADYVVANPDAFKATLFPKSRAWIDAHPDVLKTPQAVNRLIAAANLGTARGYAPDSDDLIEFVEQQMSDGVAPKIEPKPPALRRENKSAPSAPPSRDSGPTVGGKEIKLRPGDRYIPAPMKEFVERMFPGKTPEQTQANLESYYDNYVKDVNAGEIADRWGVGRR